MVVGESGLGKSTLINSLFLTDLYPGKAIVEFPEAVFLVVHDPSVN
jgi:septin family protein